MNAWLISTARLALLAAVVLAAAAPPGNAETRGGATDAFSVLATDLRLSFGTSLPLSDLGNENPREGWVGGQSMGFSAAGGLRIALMEELYLRPELTFSKWGSFSTESFDVVVVEEAGGAPVDTVSSSFSREALLGGIRFNLDYLPQTESGFTPYLTGGLGLVYMKVDDVLDVPGFGRTEPDENTLGISAVLGVGLFYQNVELLLGATFQEPGFADVSPSWITTDLSLAYSIPLKR